VSDTTQLLLASGTDAADSNSSNGTATASLPDVPATDADAEAADGAGAEPARPRRRAAGRATGPAGTTNPLTGLVLSELQSIAAQLGISGTGRMRKGQLIEAIEGRQGSSAAAPVATPSAAPVAEAPAPAPAEPAAQSGTTQSGTTQSSGRSYRAARTEPAGIALAPGSLSDGNAPAEAPAAISTDLGSDVSSESSGGQASAGQAGGSAAGDAETERPAEGRGGRRRDREGRGPREDGGDRDSRRNRQEARGDRPDREPRTDGARTDANRGDQSRGDQSRGDQSRGDQNRGDQNRGDQNRGDQNRGDQSRGDQNRGDQNRNAANGPSGGDEDEFDSRGRRRRGRFRDRNNKDRPGRGRGREATGYEAEPEIGEDDVLLPVAGVLDILDSYAFVRTSGYLPGPNDVYVSLSQVRRYGLRKGDAITGAVKASRDGEKREKFNAMARLDTVNGMEPEQARQRVDFGKLIPLYPQDRLRLETDPGLLTTRIIDLVAPLGKGQRGLIVSPPKAGKTMVLQSIANAITRNNPEAHLMVVLVDERPEEVTDMQRSVKGEVIASTFDRPAEDHTIVAELAIERAKRLVELGHDVVILLDSITRLGRAYNLAAPASGRILSGGVDSTALYPPKRFFGAARNIENGGSLTILATALVETGSRMDEVIFEEFKGTGNMELKLDRKLADKRIFPAVDVDASGTRKEEILMGKEELGVVWKLRRVMSALDQQQAIELMIGKLKQTGSNAEFLMQVQKTMPVPAGAGSSVAED
jgi:transcription termination factor Rho